MTTPRISPATTPCAPSGGWHWKEWGAELAGTAVLMFAVVSAKYWAVRAGPPTSTLWARIVIVGVVAGVAVIAIAASPLGRRSGAHLNPAVTLGLWLQQAVSRSDLAGYLLAQLIGGLVGFAAGRVWGTGVTRPPVTWAVIAPAPGISLTLSAAIEAAATAVQLGVVFWLLRDPRYARWAAPVAGALLSIAIVALAKTTGAGFNPVRGLAPDVLANRYAGLWTLLVGPLVGAAIAAGAVRGWKPVTGKLRHDPRTPCYLRCALPHTELPTALAET